MKWKKQGEKNLKKAKRNNYRNLYSKLKKSKSKVKSSFEKLNRKSNKSIIGNRAYPANIKQDTAAIMIIS